MEHAVRQGGATPATVAFLDGYLHIGLNEDEINRLANEREVHKVGPRDFATVIMERASGGTTVAGTMMACKHANIKVFATGGIGGVHRESAIDISADLRALATIPMIVVCAGAKAILDLPATLEYLETMSVPVVGYGTDEFPAFYSRGNGLGVSVRLAPAAGRAPDDAPGGGRLERGRRAPPALPPSGRGEDPELGRSGPGLLDGRPEGARGRVQLLRPFDGRRGARPQLVRPRAGAPVRGSRPGRAPPVRAHAPRAAVPRPRASAGGPPG
jgi:hypothetical protein